MNIAELNRRVGVWEFVEERDEFGGVDGVWKKIATRWAKIEPQSGSETTDNNHLKVRVGTKVIMRYMPNLTEKNRLSYGKKIYEITSVIDTKSGHYMTIVDCVEMKENGETMEDLC